MSEITARPTQRLPAPARRKQLLDAALATFAVNGYEGTSMNEVAEAAGVTKPVLYQHFASKKALYQELVLEVGSGLEQEILDAVTSAGGPRQQVEAGFRAYFRWAVTQSDAFKVLFTDRNRSDRELGSAVARVESMIADRVASLIKIEGLSAGQRQVLAAGVVGIAESTSRHWVHLELGAGDDVDTFAGLVANLAWTGLRGIHGPID